jgi:hypothetical protein
MVDLSDSAAPPAKVLTWPGLNEYVVRLSWFGAPNRCPTRARLTVIASTFWLLRD